MNRQRIGDMSMADFEREGRDRALRDDARENGWRSAAWEDIGSPTPDELDYQASLYYRCAEENPQYAEFYTRMALALETQAAVMRREGKCVCNDAEENLCENDATTSHTGRPVCDFHHQMLAGGSDAG